MKNTCSKLHKHVKLMYIVSRDRLISYSIIILYLPLSSPKGVSNQSESRRFQRNFIVGKRPWV